ncbi:MAG: PHP domain-containing protein [Desulfovibrio sp.]|jgi:predicted metal-dependent phosphoesterase TrpH|nr:PHP domain-containing protein [Desulfovibrio sp.]
MPGRRIDLHTHSAVSDGSDSPADLVRKAAALGLEAVALTDHDTLDGLDEAEAAADRLPIRFIRGCELAVHDPRQGELHLLGLWMPPPSEAMRAALRGIQEHRAQRNRNILRRLRALGMPLSLDDVLAHSRGVVPGRPHIAKALREKGYVKSAAEAFRLYIGEGKSAFFPRTLLTPETGIRLLAAEGATVALAHPFLHSSMTPDILADLLPECQAYGLTALEVYHSAHSDSDVRAGLLLAEAHGLFPTGGSDYHGAFKPGVCLGSPRVPGILLDRLEAHRKGKRPKR